MRAPPSAPLDSRKPYFLRHHHRTAPVNSLGYLRVMFAVEDIADTLARLGKHGATLVGEVVDFEDSYRLWQGVRARSRS